MPVTSALWKGTATTSKFISLLCSRGGLAVFRTAQQQLASSQLHVPSIVMDCSFSGGAILLQATSPACCGAVQAYGA